MVGIHEIPLLRIAVFAGIRGFGKEVKGFVEDNVMKCHLGTKVRTKEWSGALGQNSEMQLILNSRTNSDEPALCVQCVNQT